MGEFHDAVTTLLQAFSHGISIIKTQRGRRKKEKLSIDNPRKAAETHLNKSLKKNRADVKYAYDQDVARFGPGFATGDTEAHSSLASILFRLNAGFVSIIESFTRGRSTPTDYQTLLNLSNASRMEAMYTFQQLSARLSRSTISLPPNTKHTERHRRRRKTSKRASTFEGESKHGRSKSAPNFAVTPLGAATTEGWVRPKQGRKLSSGSKSPGIATPKRSKVQNASPRASNLLLPAPTNMPQILPALEPIPPMRDQLSTPRAKTSNRKSFMSFASDSTKLGEIPEHKWIRPPVYGAQNQSFPVTVLYPLAPYQEPEKQRSRFLRIFKRSKD